MSHSQSSGPDEPFDCEYGCMPMDHGIGIEDELERSDEPTQDFEVEYIGDGEHGFIGIIKTPFHVLIEITDPEEQREAAQRYIENVYAKNLHLEHHGTTFTGPVYDKMIRRETDGPDPLVQEPKE